MLFPLIFNSLPNQLESEPGVHTLRGLQMGTSQGLVGMGRTARGERECSVLESP